MDSALRVLLADDDATIIAPYLQSKLANQPLVQLRSVSSPDECIQCLRLVPFDVLLLDINFGDGHSTGVEVIASVRQIQPDIKIVMLSGQDDETTVLQCLERGADDFLSKTLDQLPQVAHYLGGILRNHADADSQAHAAKALAAQVGAVYVSQQMQDVFNKVILARQNPNLPVLITGATGVGKDVVARAISHGLSRPRVDVDCGAIPENLIESEFFGHLKGSFTGATTNKIGKFQVANGGDLFMDEIGNLKRSSQDRFLRAIQHGEITPLGATAPTRVKVRVIAATNENFDEMVSSGRFRQDLLERLKGVWIEIPELRSRPEDIEPIIQKIIAEYPDRQLTISATCLAVLRNYSWPGNVRELEATIREMIAVCNTNQLSILHLPERLKERLLKDVRKSSDLAVSTPVTPPASTDSRPYSLPVHGELDQVFDQLLTQYLPERFQKLGPNKSQAELAKSLGIARNTLAGYLKRLKIELPVEGTAL